MPRKKKEVEEVPVEETTKTKEVSKETTWEFEQDGVMWKKTYNLKGDVLSTVKL